MTLLKKLYCRCIAYLTVVNNYINHNLETVIKKTATSSLKEIAFFAQMNKLHVQSWSAFQYFEHFLALSNSIYVILAYSHFFLKSKLNHCKMAQ